MKFRSNLCPKKPNDFTIQRFVLVGFCCKTTVVNQYVVENWISACQSNEPRTQQTNIYWFYYYEQQNFSRPIYFLRWVKKTPTKTKNRSDSHTQGWLVISALRTSTRTLSHALGLLLVTLITCISSFPLFTACCVSSLIYVILTLRGSFTLSESERTTSSNGSD